MVMDKKGMWRIVESVIAVLLVASTLVFFSTTLNEDEDEIMIFNKLREGLDEVARDSVMRERILKINLGDESELNDVKRDIEDIIEKSVRRESLSYCVSICSFNIDGCTIDSCTGEIGNDVEIFSEERVISATIDEPDSKIVKVYVWKE
jgi:hypothetical protein